MEDDPASLELWGGIECTIARIGDIWRNQISETGHHERSCDIDRIVELGIKTIRYPILWEENSPRHPDKFDFGWTAARLGLLREKGVKVIGGLLPHGSGPGYTSLIDSAFPAKFSTEELSSGQELVITLRSRWLPSHIHIEPSMIHNTTTTYLT